MHEFSLDCMQCAVSIQDSPFADITSEIAHVIFYVYLQRAIIMENNSVRGRPSFIYSLGRRAEV